MMHRKTWEVVVLLDGLFLFPMPSPLCTLFLTQLARWANLAHPNRANRLVRLSDVTVVMVAVTMAANT